MLKALKVRNSKLRGDQGGFTIVELIIVIAIAALILVIALAVVPALRRSGRNSARNADVAAIQAQIVEWSGNNQGELPANHADFTNQVVSNTNQSHQWETAVNTVAAEKGIVYFTALPGATSLLPTVDGVHFFKGQECADDNSEHAATVTAYGANGTAGTPSASLLTGGTTTSIAIIRAVEGNEGNTGQIYTCVDDIQ